MNTDRMADFERRRAELSGLDDAALKDRFWALADQLVAPIVELARTHTSPSIERSVLLRMGIDSVSSHGIVDRIAEAGLLGKGAGHVLVRLAHRDGLTTADGHPDVRAAGRRVLADAACLADLFPTPTLGQSGACGSSQGGPR